ncbi:type II toxin-antitoxin system Phd/YefM family antitoxin [Occultella gossypii]|uniref:Antitoxin n=1 Tax=Occultella gossypii TaxID=2800820 RepID=A0ABS7S4V5_9MICO|nr:type II toxin-antitoxin system prevent-host-death family antitoxin [Occultella gossypii]MBZ2195337.1 type II toxin-antitoxin system Phd/YefM family antitoxin [Occultella gossypii]
MRTVSMHEAKTHLSRLIKEEFIVTNNGRPVARVVPLGQYGASRFGFLPAEVIEGTRIPEDFDTMAATEIAELFGVDG